MSTVYVDRSKISHKIYKLCGLNQTRSELYKGRIEVQVWAVCLLLMEHLQPALDSHPLFPKSIKLIYEFKTNSMIIRWDGADKTDRNPVTITIGITPNTIYVTSGSRSFVGIRVESKSGRCIAEISTADPKCGEKTVEHIIRHMRKTLKMIVLRHRIHLDDAKEHYEIGFGPLSEQEIIDAVKI